MKPHEIANSLRESRAKVAWDEAYRELMLASGLDGASHYEAVEELQRRKDLQETVMECSVMHNPSMYCACDCHVPGVSPSGSRANDER